MVRKNGKYGVVDLNRKILIEPIYDKMNSTTGGYYIFQKGQDTIMWKFTPMKGYPVFEKTKPAEVKEESPIPGYIKLVNKVSNKETRYGFANMKGDTLVPPIYYLGECLPDGYAIASQDGQKWGFIDIHNKVLLDFKYDKLRVKIPANMQVPLKKDDKMGVVQLPEGKVLLPFEYDMLTINKRIKARAYQAQKDKAWGIIDANGISLLPMEYDALIGESNNTLVLKKGNLYGTWSPYSEKTSGLVFDEISNRDDSICFVKKGELWALFNSVQVKEITSFKYTKINKSGVFLVGEIQENGQTMRHLLDKNGNEVLPPENATMYGFADGSCFVKRANSSIHIDEEGNLLHEFDDKSANVFDKTWISAKDKKGNPAFIHASCRPGKEIWLESVGKLSEGLRACKYNGKYGYMNDNGEWAIKPIFDDAKDASSKFLRVKYSGKWGVLKNSASK